MKERWRIYRFLIARLGLWQFLVYKLQLLRVRLFRIAQPVSLFSKRAAFPLRFRPNTSDLGVFFQVFVHQEYRCLDNARNVNLIIDCGANVGFTAAYLLSRFTAAQLIAVEPDPENFRMLEKNLAPYAGRYRALRSAIWSHATDLVIAGKEPGGEWARRVILANNEGSAHSAGSAQAHSASSGQDAVVATDIGALLQESGCARISILKIDIEGAEAAVFSTNYEGWISKIDNLVIELHGEECTSIFKKAIAPQNFTLSQCGELTVCTRP